MERGEIGELREALKAAGAFEHRPGLTSLKFLAHVIVGGGLLALCLRLPLGWALPLIPVTALVWVVGVMMGHEGTHHAAFASRRANALLRNIAFPFMSGMSGLFWRYKHNVLHHGNPNVVGVDQDLQVAPLAIGRPYHLGSSSGQQRIQRRFQAGWMLWLMTTLLPFDLRTRGLRYLVGRARGQGVDREWVIDALMLLGHFLVFLVIPAKLAGVSRAVGIYVAVWTFGGMWLGLIGLVGHTGQPLIHAHDDGWRLQFVTTRNVKMNAVLSWCFVGLDRQIEHHLFPQISHFKLPLAVPIVRRFARERNLPYKEQTLLECIREITSYVDGAWNDHAFDLSGGQLCPATDQPVRVTHALGRQQDLQ